MARRARAPAPPRPRPEPPPRSRPGSRLTRLLPRRPRLFVAIAVGIAAAWAAPTVLSPSQRAVIGWDSGACVLLGLTLLMALRATPDSMRRRAEQEDLARWTFLSAMAAAAFFSMFAIFVMVREGRGAQGGLPLALAVLAGVTIVVSWLFAHTAFAVHYAHDYYSNLSASRGLNFPDNPDSPDYWDFLYFSFVIGMTCQVSDVQVMTRPWRFLVLAHSVVAFLFNTVVLALSVNLAAGLL